MTSNGAFGRLCWLRQSKSKVTALWAASSAEFSSAGQNPQVIALKNQRSDKPTTLGRPVNARFIKRFSHRHSVCLCIFYHVYEGFVVLVLGGASTPFFMGPKRCLSQFETRDLVEYPFVFFDLCDIPQKPSPEASTQASLRDAWQQTAAPEHCVGWFYPAYWWGASGLSLD